MGRGNKHSSKHNKRHNQADGAGQGAQKKGDAAAQPKKETKPSALQAIQEFADAVNSPADKGQTEPKKQEGGDVPTEEMMKCSEREEREE